MPRGAHDWEWAIWVGSWVLAILVALLTVRRRRDHASAAGRGPHPGLSARHAGGVVPVSIDVAHALVGQALGAAGVTHLGPTRRDRVDGFTTVSWLSWGSIVTVWLSPIPGGTAFTVEARPSFPLAPLDRRRNQRIVDVVSHELNGAAMASSTAAWAPDPFHRHELRYWDGVGWTESVSDRGRTTIDPMTVSAN